MKVEDCVVGLEVGARRWPYSGAHPDAWGTPHRGDVLAVDDPLAWANTLAFPTDTPDPEQVTQHVRIQTAQGHPVFNPSLDSAVPVLWHFPQGDKVYWEPVQSLTTYKEDLDAWREKRAQGIERRQTMIKRSDIDLLYENAHRGAAKLDEIDGAHPQIGIAWFGTHRIELNYLDLAECMQCVIGQLMGRYNSPTAIRFIKNELNDRADDFGFTLPKGVTFMSADDVVACWRVLTSAWIEEIQRRRGDLDHVADDD